jgi:hypothetical protein
MTLVVEVRTMPVDVQRVQAVFLLAAEAADRAAVLDRECGADAELRRRVTALLAAHDDPGSFLDKPAIPGGVTAAPVPVTPTADSAGPGPLADGPGTVLGHYKRLHLLGVGGMGFVFPAE